MIARKRDAGITRTEQVEACMVGRRVRKKRFSAMQTSERHCELPQNLIIARAGSQRTVGAVIEPHSAVASQKHVVLHGFGWNDVRPYGQ